MQALDELRARVCKQIARLGGASPFYTAVEGMIMLQAKTERHPTHLIHKPALCIVVQGEKWTAFGERKLTYRAGQAMVVSLEMPGMSQVVEGDAGTPYLSLVLTLDQAIMREVCETLPALPPPPQDNGAFVVDLDAPLLACAARAVSLLETPDAIPLLYPGIMREIGYWLLTGPQGGMLAQRITGTGMQRRMAGVLHALRAQFSEPVRISDLAAIAGLSPSAFHRHFRALTGMTPLNFQKQLRLMEARRLMMAGNISAESAAFSVGYASASQFSREYARLFGAPPRRDIARLLSANGHETR
ncbi:AraC family transcriptional regulator (plasmid) [Chimaeribacter arupi]|uniref:AraC family transcriptional regulator n=1 Tax=Chimaeribacter arupi TaxID=2060066 RepID=A0A2N5ENB6_9GAMM|nr:AraC family transcriptional regulator [Chimaeribacter arupi]PLR50172.1 AraC family transcriptional regulator [Chimaeribacter arupi]WKZ94901.1 AraC family transcriptional regulator [Chimaeribacter arupi]